MYRLRKREAIDVATIERRGETGGFVAPVPLEEQFVEWGTSLETDVMTSLASLAGERMLFDGDNSTGVGGDLSSSTRLVMRMFGFSGMGATIASMGSTLGLIGRNPSVTVEDGTDRQFLETDFGRRVDAKLHDLLERVAALLEADRDHLLAVAHALETHKTISGEDIEAIVEGHVGPVVDGSKYHDPVMRAELETYHAAVVEAMHAQGRVQRPLPVLPGTLVVSATDEPVPVPAAAWSPPAPGPNGGAADPYGYPPSPPGGGNGYPPHPPSPPNGGQPNGYPPPSAAVTADRGCPTTSRVASAAMPEPLSPTTGLGVLHLFCRPTPAADAEAVIAAVKALRADDHQVVSVATLGHKGDIGFMALGPDLWRLRRFQTEITAAGLAVADSFVSLTELSEYAAGVPDDLKQARLFPQLPPEGKPAFCFYPMSKRRAPDQNWFTLPYDDRKELDVRPRCVGPEVRRAGAAGRHRGHWHRRLGVGGHPLRRAPGRPQGGRLHDALRRGIGDLRRVRSLHHRHGRRRGRGARPPSALGTAG